MGFGGNNGLTDFKEILGFPIQAASTRAGLFAATAIALAAGAGSPCYRAGGRSAARRRRLGGFRSRP